jgi:hypothetical protein
MRKELEIANDPIKGEYLADFYTYPNSQVHSRVFCKNDKVIHIDYFIKEGFSHTTISERWLGEIFDFLRDRKYPDSPPILHEQDQDFS